MQEEQARARFGASPVARLATVGSDGHPHLVPVVFAAGFEELFMAVDFKPKKTARLRRLANIEATGHVSLLVDRYDDDWSTLWWVRVDGRARVVDGSSADGVRAIDALVTEYDQYADLRPEGPAIVVDALSWQWWSAQ